MRDAQLTRGACRLEQVRAARGVDPLEAMPGDSPARLDPRGRALLTGAAALGAYRPGLDP